ncbi:MAG: hypothetical protein RSA84_16065 [Acinetobacter sp.]
MGEKMVAETKVKFICSENINAPILGNSFGALISVLDAALVSGVALPAISSTVIDGANIILNFGVNHNLKLFQVLRLIGFSPSQINGDFRIVGIPDSTRAAIALPAGVTGISTSGIAVLAPLGYEKSFSGTNKAAYRNANTNAVHRPFLRVDNSQDPVYGSTYAKYAKVGILKTMSGIDDISGEQVPFDSANPAKNWTGTGSGTSAYNGWAKWYYARNASPYNASADSAAPADGARQWMIVGDDQAFYLIMNFIPNNSLKLVYGFGVYDKYFGDESTPYFLASTLNYTTAGTSQDLSVLPNATPFIYSAVCAPLLVFNTSGSTSQSLVLPQHGLYKSGREDNFANTFVVRPYVLMTSTKYLLGDTPHIRYIDKIRSDNAFTAISADNYMYVIDTILSETGQVGRIGFNIGGL